MQVRCGAQLDSRSLTHTDSNAEFLFFTVKDKESKEVDSEARPMKDEAFGEYRWAFLNVTHDYRLRLKCIDSTQNKVLRWPCRYKIQQEHKTQSEPTI